MTVNKIGNRIICLGAVIAPALAATAVRFVEPSPNSATAALPAIEEPATPTPTLASEVPLSPQQARAKEAGKAPVSKDLATPFLAAAEPVLPGAPGDSAGSERAPLAERHGPMTLTSIFSGRRTVAIINGKLRRVGDEIETGWRVSEIDAGAGTVTISNTHGVRSTLRIHRISGSQSGE